MDGHEFGRSKAARMGRTGLVAAATVLAVLLAAAPPAAGQPPAGEDSPPAAAAGTTPGRHETVTLITGDRVSLTGSGSVIRPGPGRADMTFQQYAYDGHRYVIPADASDLVRSGRLDRRLFDVSGLLAAGYGDADRTDLPLIIAHEPRAAATLRASGVQVTDELSSLGLTAVRTPKQDTAALWSTVRGGDPTSRLTAGVTTIWLDGQRELTLDRSVRQVHAPTAWQAGYTGAGVTVAVLDSGIDPDHPDFAGRIREIRNFTDAPDGNDTGGHGTHVASILAGSGAASGGQYRGVAPDAELLVGKVCPTRFCPESAILAGMAWAAEQGATVVNLSLSGPDQPGTDLLERAVNQLTGQYATLFVSSAGNRGPDQPVGSPASADAALAVGSVSRFDDVSSFSSRGPRIVDAAVKPDITAPGEEIVAARAADGRIGDPVDANYTRISGTSMAAPHVAGAAALLSQRHPDWSGPQLKAALMGSAVTNPWYTVFDQGAGRLDLARAIDQSVITSPPSISFGRDPFPHVGEPLERVVTVRNLGATPVQLQLSLEVRGPTGQPAPPGMFTLAPDSVALPAGGQAGVTVSADMRVDSPLGLFSGALVATGEDGTTTRTPLGIDKEPERYQLTVTHLDRDGTPTSDYSTYLMGVDTDFLVAQDSADNPATMTLRVPPGRYHLWSTITTPTGGVVDSAGLAWPLLEITEDTSITLDARQARPMQVRVPRDTARSAAAVVQYERQTQGGQPFAGILAGPDLSHFYTAHLGPEVADTEVLAAVHSAWAEPGPTGTFMDSPYAYHLAWFARGGFWTGFQHRVAPGELARVPTEYRTPMPGRIGEHLAISSPPGWNLGAGQAFRFHLPFSRVDYYLADGVRWTHEFRTLTPATGVTETVQTTHPTSYPPGWQEDGTDVPRRVWNGGVFGPAFPPAGNPTQWMYRHGGSLPTVAGGAGTTQGSDAIAISIPLFNDASADHTGFSREDTGRIALYRDGELIGETASSRAGEFPVPDEDSGYRLEIEGSRPSYAELSTRVSGVWTFRSAHDPTAESVVLPVMAVRFGPRLDEHNTALAGRAYPLPVSIQRQALSADAVVTDLAVEVSYDDGETWQSVPVGRAGQQWLAQLHHPSGADYVSLRAEASDSTGGSVQVEIIRAYRLATPAGPEPS